MDLFGFKKRREKRHLEFLESLEGKDDKYLYDAYCALDMDVICGNTSKYTKKEISAVVDELEKRGYVNELGQIYPTKVNKGFKSDINDFIEALKIKHHKHVVKLYNEESIKPLATSTREDKLKLKAIEDELKSRNCMTSAGILTYPVFINRKELKEWDLENFGIVDNTQFNGYEVFITGEDKILRVFGYEDECSETSVKLEFVDEILEREELEYIEMNSYLNDIDVSTLGAILKFTDGSEITLNFEQINDDDDYSLDNLKLNAKYTYKKS